MPAPPVAQALIQQARRALDRLEAVPQASSSAREASEEIETSWTRVPFKVAISGEDVAARRAFLNFLAGDRWFAAPKNGTGGALLLLRRGRVTSYSVRRRDGLEEEYSLENSESLVRAEKPVGALEQAGHLSAAPVERRRPARALWRWLWGWIRALFGRRERGALAAASPGERKAPSAPGFISQRSRFVAEVHALTEGAGANGGIERISVELADAPLPSGVVVVDLPVDVRVDRLQFGLDGYLLVCDSAAPVPGARDFAEAARAAGLYAATVTSDGAPPPRAESEPLDHIGDFAAAAAALRSICMNRRALRLARRAAPPISEALSLIDDSVRRAEASFRERMERLRARRIDDPQAFRSAQLEQVRPLVTQRVHLLIEQATVELSAQLERLGRSWSGVVDSASSTEALRKVVAGIDEASPAELREVRDHAQRLATAALTGAARDLYAELTAELRERAPGFEAARVPAPDPIELAPSLSEDGGTKLGAGSRLGSLFRSVKAVRAEVHEKLDRRMARLRKVATAELLDAEHRLFEALTGPLAAALDQTLADYDAFLDQALAREQADIDRERAEMKTQVELRESLRRDRDRLKELMEEAEAELASRPPAAHPAPPDLHPGSRGEAVT